MMEPSTVRHLLLMPVAYDSAMARMLDEVASISPVELDELADDWPGYTGKLLVVGRAVNG